MKIFVEKYTKYFHQKLVPDLYPVLVNSPKYSQRGETIEMGLWKILKKSNFTLVCEASLALWNLLWIMNGAWNWLPVPFQVCSEVLFFSDSTPGQF